jgi:iron complex outermembrane receptor protein
VPTRASSAAHSWPEPVRGDRGQPRSGAPAYTYGFQARGILGPVEIGVTAKNTGGRYIYDSNLPILGGTWSRNAAGVVTNTTYQIYPAKTPAYWMVNLDARVSLEFLGLNDRTFLQAQRLQPVR